MKTFGEDEIIVNVRDLVMKEENKDSPSKKPKSLLEENKLLKLEIK